MRRSPAGMSLFAALLGLTLSTPALAQPAASSANRADATLLYNEGVAAAKLGQWDKARTFYLAAWHMKQHWQIAASLGMAEANAGKYRDAAEHLSYGLREASNVTPGERKKIQELIDQMKAKVGTLAIAVNQDGAEVRIDGAPVGTAPLKGEVFVEPGQHVVEARLEGYKPAQATQGMQAGGSAAVDLQLAKEEPTKRRVALTPGSPVKGKDEGPNKSVIMAGAVASAVTAAAGIGFTVGAWAEWNARNDVTANCHLSPSDCTTKYYAAEDARFAFVITSLTSYIVAGVLGAGTLTYALVKPAAKPRDSARADLLLGPGTAGAMITVPW